MHHLEASLAPCDHSMWIIWGRDRYHHAMTARGRRGGGGGELVPGTRLSVAPGPPRVSAALALHFPAQGSSGGTTASAPSSWGRAAPRAPRVLAATVPTSGFGVGPGAPRVPVAPTPSARLGAAPGCHVSPLL
jgi:hypothetical protein